MRKSNVPLMGIPCINREAGMIPVSLKYYLCLECGEDYEIPSANYDPLAEAYHKLAIMNKN